MVQAPEQYGISLAGFHFEVIWAAGGQVAGMAQGTWWKSA
jgi:hypothetical protein